MQRHSVLILLWLLMTAMIRVAHARHNITAALVALAPVSDNDIETSLNVADKDGNAGSTVTVSWVLMSSALILQLLAFLLRWVQEKEKLSFLLIVNKLSKKDCFGNFLITTQLPFVFYSEYFREQPLTKASKHACPSRWLSKLESFICKLCVKQHL